MEFAGVQMSNGKVLKGEKVKELAEYIINKFADEKLSVDEAKYVLDKVKDVVGEESVIQRIS